MWLITVKGELKKLIDVLDVCTLCISTQLASAGLRTLCFPGFSWDKIEHKQMWNSSYAQIVSYYISLFGTNLCFKTTIIAELTAVELCNENWTVLGIARVNKEMTKSYFLPTGISESLVMVVKSRSMSRGYVQQSVWVQKEKRTNQI